MGQSLEFGKKVWYTECISAIGGIANKKEERIP